MKKEFLIQLINNKLSLVGTYYIGVVDVGNKPQRCLSPPRSSDGVQEQTQGKECDGEVRGGHVQVFQNHVRGHESSLVNRRFAALYAIYLQAGMVNAVVRV